MNDDEFFSQFPVSPPPEFVESLRAKLALLDRTEEKALIMIQSAPISTPPHVLRQPGKRTPSDRYVTLVATLLLVLFVGIALMVNANQAPTPTPLAQVGPALIAKENAESLHHIGQIGAGTVFEAVWSPDGTRLYMPGSAGIWVFDVNDLTEPIDNLYPELRIYASLVISDDGQRMAFNSDEGVRIWDLAAQQDVTPEFSGISSSPAVIDLSPDGSVLAVGNFEGGVYLYNIQTGHQLPSWADTRSRIFDLKFSPDGKEVAFIAQGTPVLTIRDDTGEWQSFPVKPVVLSPAELTGIQALIYNDDGTRLAARTATTVYIWDTATRKEVSRLEATTSSDTLGSTNGVTNGFDGDLMFSPDGTQLVTDGSQIRRWDIEEGTSQTLYNSWKLNDGSGGIAWDGQGLDFYPLEGRVHFNPDWTQVSRVSSGVVVVNNAVTGENIRFMLGFQAKRVQDVTFSPDGTQLATWSEPRALCLWNISDLSNIPFGRYLNLQEDITTMGDNYGWQHAVFSPDKQFVAGYDDNGDIVLWNRDGTEAQHWLAPEYEKGELVFGGFIAYSADGTRLVSRAPYGSLVWVWDTETGTVIQTITVNDDWIKFGALSPDGRFIALGLRSQAIAIYDVTTGERVQTLNGHKAEVRKVVYSPDGKSLVSAATDGTVHLWNLETGSIAHTLLDINGTEALAFSPDGQLVAGARTGSVSGDHLFLWEAATGRVLVRLAENASIKTVAFSADGTRLAAGLENGTVQIWGLK